MRLRIPTLLVLIGAVLSCGDRTADRSDPELLRPVTETLVRQYFDAANAHDLERIQGMFAPDAEWSLLGGVLKGPERILAPHEQDVATNTQLSVEEIWSNGDTAWVELVERNDFLTEFGIDSIAHQVEILFSEGLIFRMAPVAPVDPFDGALDPFFGWIRTERPEAWEVLVDEEGRTRYGERSGEVLVELAREWKGR